MAISGGEYDEGPMFVRWNTYTVVGDALPPHDHQNIHWAECRVGRARVILKMPDGSTQTTDMGPEDFPVKVPAEALHSIEAVEVPCLTHCKFHHKTLAGVVTDRFCNNTGAYV